MVMREVRAEKYKPTLKQIQKSWPIYQNPGPKDFHLFVICLGDKTIGEIGYRYQGPGRHAVSLDIKIGQTSLWGQGLGTEAINLFDDYLFTKLKIQHIIAEPGDWNKRSIGLFKKCGFREIKREEVPPNDVFDGGIGVTMQRDIE